MSNSNEELSHDVLIKNFETTSLNIQHNERLRNYLFSLYLMIAGFFLALVGKESKVLPTEQIVLLASFFVWFVGVLFLWAYSRFGEMIARDAKIIRGIMEYFSINYPDISSIWDTHINYNRNFDVKKVRHYGSVTTCISLSTSLVSALMLSIGIWASLRLPFWCVMISFLLFTCGNQLLIRFFKKMWGVNP